MVTLCPEDAGLTHSQTPIWVGQRLHPESPLYNMTFAFVFPTELRTDLFCEAWRRVADGSDALRTRVLELEGGGTRRTLAVGAAPTRVLDLGPRSEPEAEFRRWCRERCARPLPLGGDLVDSVLVRLGKGRTGWYLNQHHMITDAWSTRLLYREVGREYDALVGGGGGERPELLAYYPTAAALSSRAGGPAAALEHWVTRQDRPGRTVPLYGRGGAAVGTASTRLTLELGEDRSRSLDGVCSQEGFASLSPDLSRFVLFTTLLVSWLYRVSGRTDLGFDAPVGGRPTAESKRALGLFIEMLPFAATVEAHDTFRSLGARCLEEAKLFLRHALPGASSPSGATASNVVLNYVPGAFGPFGGVQPEVEWVHPGHGDSVHALRLQVHDFAGSGQYTLHFDFNEGALPERVRRRGLEHFEKVLEACLDDPEREVASVDILVDEERQALAALNATDATPQPDRSVVAMFQARADLEPDRVALRQGRSELSLELSDGNPKPWPPPWCSRASSRETASRSPDGDPPSR